jgi:hypothetical protein
MLRKLFGGEAESKKPSQSQTMGSVTGTAQQVQAGADAMATQTTQTANQQNGLTGTEVLSLLEKLREEITISSLSSEQKNELFDYLNPVQREVIKTQPQKELVKVNLKQVSETMKSLKETTEAGKSLWTTGAEVFKEISPWVGVATTFFGL